MTPHLLNGHYIAIDQFPKWIATSNQDTSIQIADYLKCLLGRYLTFQNNYIELPSISKLVSFFKCSSADIYVALDRLETEGILYRLLNMNSLIAFWSLP